MNKPSTGDGAAHMRGYTSLGTNIGIGKVPASKAGKERNSIREYVSRVKFMSRQYLTYWPSHSSWEYAAIRVKNMSRTKRGCGESFTVPPHSLPANLTKSAIRKKSSRQIRTWALQHLSNSEQLLRRWFGNKKHPLPIHTYPWARMETWLLILLSYFENVECPGIFFQHVNYSRRLLPDNTHLHLLLAP